jgi:hypothetical protein
MSFPEPEAGGLEGFSRGIESATSRMRDRHLCVGQSNFTVNWQ